MHTSVERAAERAAPGCLSPALPAAVSVGQSCPGHRRDEGPFLCAFLFPRRRTMEPFHRLSLARASVKPSFSPPSRPLLLPRPSLRCARVGLFPADVFSN